MIKTNISKKTKLVLGLHQIGLFIIVVILITLFILKAKSIYLISSILVCLLFVLQLSIVFDYNKTYVISDSFINVTKKLKLKDTYLYKDVKDVYTTRFFYDKFIVVNLTKNGSFLLSINDLSKEDINTIKRYFKIKNKEINDKSNILK